MRERQKKPKNLGSPRIRVNGGWVVPVQFMRHPFRFSRWSFRVPEASSGEKEQARLRSCRYC